MNESMTSANKAFAIEAIAGAFIKSDTTIPNGSAAIPDVIRALPLDFKYEMGLVVGEGEYVMIHGRYTGWAPKPVVAVDIFRIIDGKLVEH